MKKSDFYFHSGEFYFKQKRKCFRILIHQENRFGGFEHVYESRILTYNQYDKQIIINERFKSSLDMAGKFVKFQIQFP